MDQPRPEFTEWLKERIQHEGGLRVSANKAGISHATLLRAQNGEALSLSTLEGISNWTGVSLVRLLNLYSGEMDEDRQLEETLSRVLDEHPELKETLLASLDVLDDEAVGAGLLRDQAEPADSGSEVGVGARGPECPATHALLRLWVGPAYRRVHYHRAGEFVSMIVSRLDGDEPPETVADDDGGPGEPSVLRNLHDLAPPGRV